MKLTHSYSNASSWHRIRYVSLVAVLASVAFPSAVLAADTKLENVIRVTDKKLKVAQTSQGRVDKLTEQRRVLYNEFKAVNKEIEGLKVYNKQLNKQILKQRSEMERIRNTIEGVTVTQRQITPLMLRMIEGLKRFVILDMPFLKEERENRVARLEQLIDDVNISVAEKFRAVMQAYQIENDYGSTIESYKRVLPINGADLQVEILRVGRIAMVYQTPDGKYSGYWDNDAGQWLEASAGSDRSNIGQGLKIAKKQASVDLITIPVKAPEAAR